MFASAWRCGDAVASAFQDRRSDEIGPRCLVPLEHARRIGTSRCYRTLAGQLPLSGLFLRRAPTRCGLSPFPFPSAPASAFTAFGSSAPFRCFGLRRAPRTARRARCSSARGARIAGRPSRFGDIFVMFGSCSRTAAPATFASHRPTRPLRGLRRSRIERDGTRGKS